MMEEGGEGGRRRASGEGGGVGGEGGGGRGREGRGGVRQSPFNTLKAFSTVWRGYQSRRSSCSAWLCFACAKYFSRVDLRAVVQT